MTFLLRFTSRRTGRVVGTDQFGNTYFEAKKIRAGEGRPRRWVIYARDVEATMVPPEWHGWLHHAHDRLPEGKARPWQKPHRPNLTGTAHSYRPAGHDYAGGQRRSTAGDYEAWTPGS